MVLNDVKAKMNDKQINEFINKAGLIIWDKAKAYAVPTFRNTTLPQQNNADSIVVLPVALPDADNINAALVAQLYRNGDSIVYSTHFKNHFSSIDTTLLPGKNITAQELYVLGMAELDAEVFGHKKFILTTNSLSFGQQANLNGGSAAVASFISVPGECEYNFTYSSSVVFPPVIIYTYHGSCGSPIVLPPIIYLNALDESYGFVSYSSAPSGQGGGGPVWPYSTQYSTFYQSLNASQQAFLENPEYADYNYGFIDYLVLHQFSQDAQDHIVWCLDYLLSPSTLITTFPEFAASYLNDFPSLSFLSTDDINWLNNHPYLKSRVYYFLQQKFVLNKEQRVQFHINKMRTEESYFIFNTAYSTYPQYQDLWFNDYVYLYSLGGKTFGEWAINYLMQNPTVAIETFQNQFMGKSEGYDSDFDEAFWDNSANTFLPQTLPTWSDFEAAYPKTNAQNMAASDVFDLVGGTIKALRDGVLNDSDPSNDHQYDNACALRTSRALNYCGIVIPYISGQTFKGDDDKYYFLGAANLNRWMRKTFGCANPNTTIGEYYNVNASHFTTAQIGQNGENLPGLLIGKKGIYTIVTKSTWASGHCDMLYDDATCMGDCHFDAPTTIYYCDVWDLQ